VITDDTILLFLFILYLPRRTPNEVQQHRAQHYPPQQKQKPLSVAAKFVFFSRKTSRTLMY
jgi:hypothetical protein